MNKTRWILGAIVAIGVLLAVVLAATGAFSGYGCNNFC